MPAACRASGDDAGGQRFVRAKGNALVETSLIACSPHECFFNSMTTEPESSMAKVSEGVKNRLASGEWYVACGTDGIEPLENEEREHCLVENETFVCYVVKKD
ncbi:hypothetical protein COOONC_25618 [Cooperia oncophora]